NYRRPGEPSAVDREKPTFSVAPPPACYDNAVASPAYRLTESLPMCMRTRWPLLPILLVTALSPFTSPQRLQAAEPEQTPLFVAGQDGYHTYRIPALLVTRKGTLLAFCEGRKKARGDAGDIDLLLKRSLDGGRTWQKTQVVWDDGDNTCGNPCPVVER